MADENLGSIHPASIVRGLFEWNLIKHGKIQTREKFD